MAAKKKYTPAVKADVPKEISPDMFYGLRLDDEQAVFANAIWNPDIDIVLCDSAAGCGKTQVSTGVACMLVQYGLFRDIIYIVAPYGEQTQGYLPGTITEKSSVYFEPFYQALINCGVNPNTAINTESMVNQKNGTGFITCITDTYLRGSNLDNAVVIIDEAQNFTIPQLKKTLTRVGKHTKVVVIGHELQCDIPDPSKSGFIPYLHHFENEERAAVCKLSTNHRGWISRHADTLGAKKPVDFEPEKLGKAVFVQ